MNYSADTLINGNLNKKTGKRDSPPFLISPNIMMMLINIAGPKTMRRTKR